MNNTLCIFCRHEFEQEPLTFRRILQAYDKIVIPRIQRDYAQGRSENHPEEVRKNLLSDIFENNGAIDFGFVFGTQTFRKSGQRVERCFIPIDGQQRLTTLFLLYLFQNWWSPNDESLPKELQKFSYETREHAKAFCHFLTKTRFTPRETGVREFLENQVEFVDVWKTDPTVDGMLRMLDAIRLRYLDYPSAPNLDAITFRFFDLEQFALSDALYIQMNARGWPLTAFEAIKASLDKLAERYHPEGDNKWLEDWQMRVDDTWPERFWEQYKQKGDVPSNPVLERVDKPMLRTMARAAALFFLEQTKDINAKKASECVPKLLSVIGDEAFLSFSHLSNALAGRDHEGNPSYLAGLAFLREFLDFIVSTEAELAIQPAWQKVSLLEFLSESQATQAGHYGLYKRLLILYAAFKCRAREWMRVVWNIIENESIDDLERFVGAFKLLTELCPHANDIETFLATNSPQSDFAGEQVNEERLKAHHLVGPCGEQWRQTITHAESHPLLRGNLSALLNVTDSATSFAERIRAFDALLPREQQEDGDHYYQICRAMLGIGDCRQPRNGHWLFPSRRATFDSMLHFRTAQDLFRGVLQNLLQEFPDGLELAAEQYGENELANVETMGWRYYFLRYPSEFLGNGNGYYHWDAHTPGMPMWKMTSENLRGYHCNPFLLAISDQQEDTCWASSRAGDGKLHLHGSNVIVEMLPDSNGFLVRGVDRVNSVNGAEIQMDATGAYRITINANQDLIEVGKCLVDTLRRNAINPT